MGRPQQLRPDHPGKGGPKHAKTDKRKPAEIDTDISKYRHKRKKSSWVLLDSRPFIREAICNILQQMGTSRVITLSGVDEVLKDSRVRASRIKLILYNLGSASVRDDYVREGLTSLLCSFPSVPLNILCDRDDASDVVNALALGVSGYIPTTLEPRILVEVLNLVEAGGKFAPVHAIIQSASQTSAQQNCGRRQSLYDPDVCQEALSEKKQALEASDPVPYRLTPRQLEVLQLLRQGRQNKLIACELNMQESTVKVHVRQIMRRLGATNRTEAVVLANKSETSEVVKDVKFTLTAPITPSLIQETRPKCARQEDVAT